VGRALMIQGTASSVGKSMTVAALCRIYHRRGIRVAPFKAQNMSNNAAVTPDGGEIGRAQALQAIAAGLEPRVEMNPILLKPETDSRSQVIVLGKVWKSLRAGEFYGEKEYLWQVVTKSLDQLLSTYELVIIEGAGSPVELNLRSGDIVNMEVAKYAKAPVILVGDIERGGIFAQLLGTLWLLPPEERKLVTGLIVNKFRGEETLFREGVKILENRSGVPVLGVVHYVQGLGLPEEDAATIENTGNATGGISIAVIHLPHISNFDDFDPLDSESGVEIRFVGPQEKLDDFSAVVIPGTKSTMADAAWMRRNGLFERIVDFRKKGGKVLGICGGYQILGRVIRDPLHIESREDRTEGIGLLPTETIFSERKVTARVEALIMPGLPEWLSDLGGVKMHGYEIHNGYTVGNRPWVRIMNRNGTSIEIESGDVSVDGRVLGTYLHGIFENERFRHSWLQSLGWAKHFAMPEVYSVERRLDFLAEHFEESLDMKALDSIIGL